MKTRFLVLAALVIGGSVVYVRYTRHQEPPRISQLNVDRGDISDVASATGTLQPMRTVQIGSQVTGVVTKLYVDFNSIVHEGQLLAEIDRRLPQQDLDSAKAAEEKAEVDLGQDKAVLDNDRTNLARSEELFRRDLMAASDRETAEVQTESDEMKVQQDASAITIAEAAITQAQLNLDHCRIVSPINGIVIERDVDEGQTVTSTVSAPTLFILATDLTHLQLMAEIDESEIGKIHEGQDVSFTVDAYPGTTFQGKIAVMRLTSNNVNNVVTYDTVVTVDNPDLRLRPEMTTSIKIEAAHVAGVLRVPNLALRFKPTTQMYTAFHQTPIDVTGQPGPQVWRVRSARLERVPVHVGLTDGKFTEVRDTDLQPGDAIVAGIFVPPPGR
jgi:HlyD family secretion protein